MIAKDALRHLAMSRPARRERIDGRRVHRHIAYVPADVALWPGLTGAEILELLGNVGPGVDATYRDELVDCDFGRLFPYIC